MESTSPSDDERWKNLRAFTSKHRPTLAECGVRALDLMVDPSRAFRDTLSVFVHPRPNTSQAATFFIVVEARICPIEDYGPVHAAEMKKHLALVSANHQRLGLLGTFFVVLQVLEEGKVPIVNVVPFGFGKKTMKGMKPGMPWKELLSTLLNEGHVI